MVELGHTRMQVLEVGRHFVEDTAPPAENLAATGVFAHKLVAPDGQWVDKLALRTGFAAEDCTGSLGGVTAVVMDVAMGD